MRATAVCRLTGALFVLVLGTAPWAGTLALPQGAAGKSPGKPHLELPDTTAETCVTCHEDITKGEVVHGPVSGGMCVACHEFDGKGDDTRVRLTGEATKESVLPLCAGCHEEVATVARGERAHGPVAGGDCLACHDPHRSANRGLTKAKGTEVCVACHDTAAELTRPHVHAPARADCALCHDPHGAPEGAHLRAAVNDLCLACHMSSAQREPAPPTPTLLGRTVSGELAPLLTPGKNVLLDPLKRRGHPVGNHPVRGSTDPAAEGRPLTCASCHAAHGSALPALRRFGDDATDFCVKCHK